MFNTNMSGESYLTSGQCKLVVTSGTVCGTCGDFTAFACLLCQHQQTLVFFRTPPSEVRLHILLGLDNVG